MTRTPSSRDHLSRRPFIGSLSCSSENARAEEPVNEIDYGGSWLLQSA